MLVVKLLNLEGYIVKKILLIVPFALALYACGAENSSETETNPKEIEQEAIEQETEGKISLASNAEWEIDERLQEPTEDTVCVICNMKVYTKDHEQGVFSAQAVREDGSVVFYDDIGCLLNDEYVNGTKNEKFVRDYNTLNWFNVDEAIVVKTDLKSPMNWGYIYFKYQEDADAYIAEHPHAAVTPLDQVREEGIERHKQMEANGGHGHDHDHSDGEHHSEGHGHDTTEEDHSSEENHE